MPVARVGPHINGPSDQFPGLVPLLPSMGLNCDTNSDTYMYLGISYETQFYFDGRAPWPESNSRPGDVKPAPYHFAILPPTCNMVFGNLVFCILAVGVS
ncbi:hypothetical protein XENTR_v10007717 [Xenopus tropicalis]|nr:hypothetical protein XENTR_v10007717 [Xenopus tropicalis]